SSSFVLLSFEELSLLVLLLLLSSLSSSFESSLESFDSFVVSVCSVLLSSVFSLFVVSTLLLHAAKVRDNASNNEVTLILLFIWHPSIINNCQKFDYINFLLLKTLQTQHNIVKIYNYYKKYFN